MTHQEWIETILKKYQDKYEPAPSEIEHILEFLEKHPKTKVSTRVSYLSMRKKASDWIIRLNKKNKNLKEEGVVQVIREFSDGSSFVRLLDQTAKDWEGKHMGHCVASYTKHSGIYSLRDANNFPHCTVEVVDWCIKQIKGKANKEVSFQYHLQVLEGIKKANIHLTGRDIKHIGFVNLTTEEKMILKEHFDNAIWFEIEGVQYFNIHSKLTLIKPFTKFNQVAWANLYKGNFNCFDAFKQILNDFAVDLTDDSLVNLIASQGKINYLKFLFSLAEAKSTTLSGIPEAIVRSVMLGNYEVIKLLLEKVPKEKNNESNNPYYHFIERKQPLFLQQAVSIAIDNSRLDILMLLLKFGGKITPDRITSLLIAAMKKNNLEAFKIALRDSILTVEKAILHFKYVPSLYKEQKFALLSELESSLKKEFLDYTSRILDVWLENHIDDLSFLDYVIKNHGFKEKDYIATFEKILAMPNNEKLMNAYIARGANLDFDNGKALKIALKVQNLKLAKKLIKEGYLELVQDLPESGQEAMQLLVRDYLMEQNQEFLFSLLAKMEKFDYYLVVRLLNLGGIMTPKQRAIAVDNGLMLISNHSKESEYEYKDLESMEADLDSYAEKFQLLEGWSGLTLLQKKKKKENHQRDEKYKEDKEKESKQQAIVEKIREKRMSNGASFRRTKKGYYCDEDGRVFRQREEYEYAILKNLRSKHSNSWGEED